MVNIKLKYLVQDVDRHGNVRSYVRLRSQRKVRIRGLPGSDAFMSAYHDALVGHDQDDKQRCRRAPKGSFGHLCLGYYASPDFKRLDQATQYWQRAALDRICQKHADKPVALMTSKHVKRLRDELKDTPSQSHKLLKALRGMFRWANESEEADNNPALGVKSIQYLTKGYHTWTAAEVQAFEARHPIGTKARLAMALLLYTACRREDVIKLGPQHITHGRIRFRQAKNEHRVPVDVDIPLHADLSAVLAATPSGHLTFLITARDTPFTLAGFSSWFRDRCNEAGLSHCSAHGLRKACATRLAERGASAHEIMSVTGHKSLEQVERYTRRVQRGVLADSAIAKLK
jgi:integrase/recombinase XerD